ncbi:MAG: methylated-DNA--[protein]-cysteine S-methyltransferase [Planctomycetes bacterium]|nr:methylated-DNA--[protein]-cysteine S-methyltransferase [Planctomycetota bacterium]
MPPEASWRVLSPPGFQPGAIRVVATDRGVTKVDLWSRAPPRFRRAGVQGSLVAAEGGPECPVLARAVDEVVRYFAGEVFALETPIDWLGRDDGLALRVWRELRRVPYGRTISYGELARGVGHPRAARAVGQAVGRNPVPVFVPCHRVVGSAGHLTGFSCGLEIKIRLLELEGVRISSARLAARRRVIA